MAIIPFDKLDKYIATTAFEIGHETMNMLVHFMDNSSSRERVIENVTRRLKEAMDTIDESSVYGGSQGRKNYLPESEE